MMDPLEHHGRPAPATPVTAPSIYAEVARWIACQRDEKDAQRLFELTNFLSRNRWSYAIAYEMTEGMDEPSFSLAQKLLEQFLLTGACKELRRVSRELHLMLPSASDLDVGT